GDGPSPNARPPAPTTRCASSLPAFATAAILSPVEGAYVGKVSPDCPSTQAPSMNSCVAIATPLKGMLLNRRLRARSATVQLLHCPGSWRRPTADDAEAILASPDGDA